MKSSCGTSYMRLSLLQHLSSFYPPDLLKDAYLIGCQHILPSTHFMLRSLFDIGLEPQRTALIGKCYSTSTDVQDSMLSEGITVCPSSSHFNSHQSFDDQFQHNLAHFFENTLSKFKPPKEALIIILDDGGELISLANKILIDYENVFAVEQTSSGYHKLININLRMPVINVARSRLKLMVESSFIIETQIKEMIQQIQRLDLNPQKCLIVGNGALGQCLTQRLSPQYQVTCYDKLSRRSDIERTNLNLLEFDLIIGTTGQTIIKQADYHNLKKDTILVSTSSSDREFDAVHIRRAYKEISHCHENLIINSVHLLNCGFPINFQGGSEDSISLHKIQLTMGLLFGGICQGVALRNSYQRKGLVHMESALQKNVYRSFFMFLNGEVVVERGLKSVNKKKGIVLKKINYIDNHFASLPKGLGVASKLFRFNQMHI